jgi:hypothetical protein
MAGKRPGPIGRINQLNQSLSAGSVCRQLRAKNQDEITPIANYIAAEMNTNAHCAEVKKMAKLNRFSASACINDFNKLPLLRKMLGFGITPQQCVEIELTNGIAALIAWGRKVRQNSDWDHKPKIASRFNSCVPGQPQHWHLYGNTIYSYDIWSNLHYGYVGRAAGFSDAVLLDGAGLEQIGSTLLRLEVPKRTLGVDGLRAWDTREDRAAITLGIDLYRRNPNWVTVRDVMSLVLSSKSIRTKPLPQ